ncbi:hypothetical protein WR25_15057 [Diploscapter pachys]|uniref:Uncharacterized protein n=1 Tax=Diploscapter pachys TaxID=2018661 RepID=A0A2A2L0W5_9BILA|nr:hypothetical protein WR25_15057 [Diploscapter pachys]
MMSSMSREFEILFSLTYSTYTHNPISQVLLTFGVLSLIMNLIVIGFSLYHFFHLEKVRHKNYIANLKQDLNKARRALHSDDGKLKPMEIGILAMEGGMTLEQVIGAYMLDAADRRRILQSIFVDLKDTLLKNYIESFPRFLERGYEPEKFFLNLHTNPTNPSTSPIRPSPSSPFSPTQARAQPLQSGKSIRDSHRRILRRDLLHIRRKSC